MNCPTCISGAIHDHSNKVQLQQKQKTNIKQKTKKQKKQKTKKSECFAKNIGTLRRAHKTIAPPVRVYIYNIL
jgi:hypothetical protein